MMLCSLLMRCCALTFLLWRLLDVSVVLADPEVLQSVGKLRSNAEVLFSEKQYDKALEMWSKVIAMEPDNDSNYYKRFRVYLTQQKYKEALADLNAALTRNPQNENALSQRAKLNMRLGRCEESERDLVSLKR